MKNNENYADKGNRQDKHNGAKSKIWVDSKTDRLFDGKLDNGGYKHYDDDDSFGSALPHFIRHFTFQFTMRHPNPHCSYRQ
jgi:hypothetical protein